MKKLNKLWQDQMAQYLIKNYISLNNGSLEYNEKLVKKLAPMWLDRAWAERYDMGVSAYLKARKSIKEVIRYLDGLKGREL